VQSALNSDERLKSCFKKQQFLQKLPKWQWLFISPPSEDWNTKYILSNP
jgi:hypothetical protein